MPKSYYKKEKFYKAKKPNDFYLYLMNKREMSSVLSYKLAYKSFLSHQRWLRYLTDAEILIHLEEQQRPII